MLVLEISALFVLFVLSIALYLLPMIVGTVRNVRHLGGITLLTLFLGWTFIGWLGALIWAVSDKPRLMHQP